MPGDHQLQDPALKNQCRIRQRSPCCCGEHPVLEHQPDRESGASGRNHALPRRNSNTKRLLTGQAARATAPRRRRGS
jgi:hypothetical protein